MAKRRGIAREPKNLVADFVIQKAGDYAAKKVNELVGKGIQKGKKYLHQKIEQAGKYAKEKIYGNVKDKDTAALLSSGVKNLKNVAHQGVKDTSGAVKKFTETKVDKLTHQAQVAAKRGVARRMGTIKEYTQQDIRKPIIEMPSRPIAIPKSKLKKAPTVIDQAVQ